MLFLPIDIKIEGGTRKGHRAASRKPSSNYSNLKAQMARNINKQGMLLGKGKT